jgi:hypothetical protein
MHLVGVGGQLQNGKDTIADELAILLGNKTEMTWQRVAFARDVKRIFSETFNVDYDFIEKWKVVPEPPPGFDMSVRKALQFIGDGFRQIQSNIWIELAMRNMDRPSVCSDIRYINELKKIFEMGGLTVLVWRPGKENNDKNGSEAQIRPLIDWLVKHKIEGNVATGVGQLSRTPEGAFLLSEAPYGIEFVDLFIHNNEGIEQLHEKVREIVLPRALEKMGFN